MSRLCSRLLPGAKSKRLPPDWATAGLIPPANVVSAYQAKGAPSLAASLVNLASPGVRNLSGTVPDFVTETGWTFGGTQFMSLGVAPTATTSVAVRYSNAVADAYMFGELQTNPENTWFYFSPVKVADPAQSQWGWGDKNSAITGSFASGTVILIPKKGYIDGVDVTTAAGQLDAAVWNGNALTLYIGNRAAEGAFRGKVQAVAIYNIVLSDAQILAVHSAMMGI